MTVNIIFFGQVHHVNVHWCEFFGHVHKFCSYSFGHLFQSWAERVLSIIKGFTNYICFPPTKPEFTEYAKI